MLQSALPKRFGCLSFDIGPRQSHVLEETIIQLQEVVALTGSIPPSQGDGYAVSDPAMSHATETGQGEFSRGHFNGLAGGCIHLYSPYANKSCVFLANLAMIGCKQSKNSDKIGTVQTIIFVLQD
jgi:hypothetical protein